MPRAKRVFTPLPGEPQGDLDYNDPRVLDAIARVTYAERVAAERWGSDPWLFLTEAVWTVDQITGQTRQFPEKTHLQYLTTLWKQELLLAVPKSRRMMVTWWGVAVNVWLGLYTPLQKIVFFAGKEGKHEGEGSAELVWRAKFILDHLPGVVPRVAYEYAVGRLVLPNGSEIIGLPQGSDQARQMTISSALLDEVARWEWAYDTWIALRPTVEGGGRITMVSTAAAGCFFQRVVQDDLDNAA